RSGREQRSVHGDLRRLLSDVQIPDRNREVLQVRGDQIEIAVDAVTLNGEALRIDELAVGTEREIPVARIDVARGTVQHEKPIALNGQVRRTARVRDAALGEVGRNGRDGGPQADLLGVRAAVRGRWS